jgi:PKD repeat protein
MDQESRVADALTKPRRPLVTAGIIAAVVVALSGAGVGAYAIGQAVTAAPTEITAATEPTYTPAPNVAPVAIINASTSDLTVSVDGSSTVDGDGEIVEYAWNFGDGATGTGATASHAYGGAGTYTVTLTVTDDEGATGEATRDVTVNAPPPPPPAPSGPDRCPAGTTVNSNDGTNDTSCLPNICLGLTLPDPAHPECDYAYPPDHYR